MVLLWWGTASRASVVKARLGRMGSRVQCTVAESGYAVPLGLLGAHRCVVRNVPCNPPRGPTTIHACTHAQNNTHTASTGQTESPCVSFSRFQSHFAPARLGSCCTYRTNGARVECTRDKTTWPLHHARQRAMRWIWRFGSRLTYNSEYFSEMYMRRYDAARVTKKRKHEEKPGAQPAPNRATGKRCTSRQPSVGVELLDGGQDIVSGG